MLDKSSEEMLPPFKTFTLWDYFEKYFLAFFYIRSQLRSFSEMPVVDSVTKNPIRNHQKRTMKANAVISKDFSLQEFKKVGRKFNVTFNDVVLACQAKATRVYFDHHNPNKNFSPVMSYMATSERVDATIGNCILAAFVTLELPLDA